MIFERRFVWHQVVGSDDEVPSINSGLLAPQQPEGRSSPGADDRRASDGVDGVGARRLPGVHPHGAMARLCGGWRRVAVSWRQDEVCAAAGSAVAGAAGGPPALADLSMGQSALVAAHR